MMYLYHFGLKKLPFSLTPDTELFYRLPSHTEAINTLKFALSTGEAFCKVTGEVGSGKTMLCRLLVKKIGDQRQVAYIPNPVLTPRELKRAIAHELQIDTNVGEELLIPNIQKKLIELVQDKGPVILIIDEAQSMPDETLEALRLFTNLETETNKLIQIIMFGQPELNDKLKQRHLRQLMQRINFSYELKPINSSDVKDYIGHRLSKLSNHAQGQLFSYSALKLITFLSGGIPRLVNILCHKSLMLCYGKKRHKISIFDVWFAAKDTESIRTPVKRIRYFILCMGLCLFSSTALAWWVMP